MIPIRQKMQLSQGNQVNQAKNAKYSSRTGYPAPKPQWQGIFFFGKVSLFLTGKVTNHFEHRQYDCRQGLSL